MLQNMQNKWMNVFLKDFFSVMDCKVTEEPVGMLKINLTEKMDKAFMNRPFYWQYMKSTGQIGKPMTWTLITNPNLREEKGEWIHFGTERWHQIQQFLSNLANFTLLFEQLNPTANTMLQPWLLLNCRIIYEGKQIKEEFFSFGINLIEGKMFGNMMEMLEKTSLAQTISDRCYTISPIIKIESGMKRIESFLDKHVEEQDHTWAVESYQLLEEELAMLHHFYLDAEDSSGKEDEARSLKNRLAPVITYEFMQGGLLYLQRNFGK